MKNKTLNKRKLFTVLAATLMLTACSGGGGDDTGTGNSENAAKKAKLKEAHDSLVAKASRVKNYAASSDELQDVAGFYLEASFIAGISSKAPVEQSKSIVV